MEANLSADHRYKIPARTRLVFCALAVAAIVAMNPAVHGQTRGPVDRSNRTGKNLGVVDVRTRIVTDGGAFIIYDAPRAEGEPPGQAGYLAYWKDFAADEVFVYGRVIEKRSDLVHALLSLRHDFGIDPHDLTPNVFKHDLPDVEGMESVEGRAWYTATRDRVMEIVGLWSPEDFDGSPERTYSGGVAMACPPCYYSVTPGGDAGLDAPLTGDEYVDGVMAACGCCDPVPVCPPSCYDGNPCTYDYCNVNCYYAYCVHAPSTCNDGLLCTIDGCNPATGCYHTDKNCDDGLACTYDRCNATSGACYYTPRCSVDRVCCPADTDYFCCQAGEDLCCPTNPAYADHCCNSGEGKTCCAAGCCLSTQKCCNGVCGTKGACCFFETGSCSEETSLCCAQQGGTFQGGGTTCTPGDLCRPKCENCHAVNLTMYECGHYISNPLGPCALDECFQNIMTTASCDSFPYRKGPRKCDTYEIAGEAEFVSKSYWLSDQETCVATNPGGFHPWQELYFGCGETCELKPNPPTGVRCDTGPCGGEYFAGGDEPRGTKKACGCPPP